MQGMIKSIIIVVVLICSLPVWSQIADVELIEEKQPKRWLLYAQNNTDEEKEAFLMVRGEGFRRSASRPVIKKVPPNSKVLMITLVPLKDITPTYTTIFNYDSQLQTLEKNHIDSYEEYVNIRPLKSDELTVFVIEDCPKCDQLINHLNTAHIKYRRLDVRKHNKVQEFMFAHLKDSVTRPGLIKLPVLMYKDIKYFNITSVDEFIRRAIWEQ